MDFQSVMVSATDGLPVSGRDAPLNSYKCTGTVVGVSTGPVRTDWVGVPVVY